LTGKLAQSVQARDPGAVDKMGRTAAE
jgi:hypothetical protein